MHDFIVGFEDYRSYLRPTRDSLKTSTAPRQDVSSCKSMEHKKSCRPQHASMRKMSLSRVNSRFADSIDQVCLPYRYSDFRSPCKVGRSKFNMYILP